MISLGDEAKLGGQVPWQRGDGGGDVVVVEVGDGVDEGVIAAGDESVVESPGDEADVVEARHRLVAVHRDEGISGTKEAADRPGLACALDAVERGQAAGVVVYRLDRLARSLTVQEAVLGHVWRRDGRVFAVDTGEGPADDPSDPMRTFVRQAWVLRISSNAASSRRG